MGILLFHHCILKWWSLLHICMAVSLIQQFVSCLLHSKFNPEFQDWRYSQFLTVNLLRDINSVILSFLCNFLFLNWNSEHLREDSHDTQKCICIIGQLFLGLVGKVELSQLSPESLTIVNDGWFWILDNSWLIVGVKIWNDNWQKFISTGKTSVITMIIKYTVLKKKYITMCHFITKLTPTDAAIPTIRQVSTFRIRIQFLK